MERRRRDYYDRLQSVRETGRVDEWLDFFLFGVTEQANDAVKRAETLADLREQFRLRLHGHRSRAIEVVDLVFENPVLTTNRVADRLDVTVQSALNYIRKLQDLDIVIEVEGIAGRSKRWLAKDVYRALDPDEIHSPDTR